MADHVTLEYRYIVPFLVVRLRTLVGCDPWKAILANGINSKGNDSFQILFTYWQHEPLFAPTSCSLVRSSLGWLHPPIDYMLGFRRSFHRELNTISSLVAYSLHFCALFSER